MPLIRIECVDDHRVMREGLEVIINQQRDMRVVASASSGEEAVELFRRHRPDVTLMDLRLPKMSGIEAIRAIKREDPGARLVVLTMYTGDEDVHRALEAGAVTYLLKDTVSDELIRVVREVHSGARPIAPSVAARLAERASHPTLSRREIEVISLVAQGLRNKEIAATMGISETTVQVHVKNIYAKLDVKDRTAAVTVALRRGIVHLPE